MNEYISVESGELPDDHENVLIKLDGRIETGAYLINGEWQPTGVVANTKKDVEVVFNYPVTHWKRTL